MAPAEQNYDIHDKELLAIVDTFRECRCTLQEVNHQVKVIKDHKNLTFFTTTKQMNLRQTRWHRPWDNPTSRLRTKKDLRTLADVDA